MVVPSAAAVKVVVVKAMAHWVAARLVATAMEEAAMAAAH